MTQTSDKPKRFENCELDLATRELRRAGELVSLEPRVFALLVYLLEQRHRAVDKDEIQDVVWKGVIVSETALTRAIMKARRAVGDSAEKQAIIRTVHGHGYQFVAALADEKPDSPEVPATQPSRFGTPRVFAALIVLLVASFIYFVWPVSAPETSVRLAVMPVQNSTQEADYDWIRLGLMGFANDLIVRSAKLNILSPSNVIRFVESNDAIDRDDEQAAADLLQLRSSFGASHMLLSELEKSGSVLRLTYALHKPDGDVERGTMVGAEPTELMRGMIRIVGAMLGVQQRAVDEISVVSKDPFINEAYSRGLGLALEGRCAEALKLFVVVIDSGETAGRAEYEWASCARIMGRWQEAEAAFEKILDGLPLEPASRLRALALNGLGTVFIRTGRGDEARETFELALTESKSAGDYLLQGIILNSLAIDAKNRREFSPARRFLERSVLAHKEAEAGPVRGQVPAAYANIDMAEGKFEQADNHLREALAAYRAIGDRRNEAMMLNNYGYLRRLQGRREEAEPLHLQSLDIRREIGDLVGQGRILGMLSMLYKDEGRLVEAREAANEAFRIASRANDKLFMATGLAQLASVDVASGDFDAARSTYAEAGALFLEIDDYSRFAQVTIRLAHIDLQTNDLVAASKSAHKVLEMARQEVLQEPAIEAMELIGDIAGERSDPLAATSAYQDALKYIEETGFVSRKSSITIKLANTQLDQGDLSSTEALIGYLIEAGDTYQSLKLRARYAFVKGDAPRSVRLMEEARAIDADDWTDADAEILVQYREAN